MSFRGACGEIDCIVCWQHTEFCISLWKGCVQCSLKRAALSLERAVNNPSPFFPFWEATPSYEHWLVWLPKIYWQISLIFTSFVPLNCSFVIWSLIWKRSLHVLSLIKYKDSFGACFWLTDILNDIESMGLHGLQMGQTQDNTPKDRWAGEGKSSGCGMYHSSWKSWLTVGCTDLTLLATIKK